MRSLDVSSMWPISFPIVAVYCQILSLKVLTRRSETLVLMYQLLMGLVKRSRKSRLKPQYSTSLQIIIFLPGVLPSGTHSRLSATVMPAVISPLVSTWTLQRSYSKSEGLILLATVIGSCNAKIRCLCMFLLRVLAAKAATMVLLFLISVSFFSVFWFLGSIITSSLTGCNG